MNWRPEALVLAITENDSNNPSGIIERDILIGRLKAVKPIDASYFHVGNLEKDTSETTMQQYILEKLGIQCISCYPLTSKSKHKGNGFRVCIRTLDANNQFYNYGLMAEKSFITYRLRVSRSILEYTI